jgi:hypothetical protein
MKFLVSWKIPKANADAGRSRFLQTGGAPPAGVKMIGRWHGMNGGGFAVAETDDAKALYTWYEQWADLLELEVTPCMEDAAAGEVIAGLVK